MTEKEKLRDRQIRKYLLGYTCNWPKESKSTKFNFVDVNKDEGDQKQCSPLNSKNI